MTIQVQHQAPGSDSYELSCMPVIRFPNFTDLSGDISPDAFFLLVGNEKGGPLEKIALRELLGNLRAYLHDPNCWKGSRASLLADNRDSHVLVSAQACFLPIPQESIAEFNPVLFNYQSYAGDPAVLTILATREGTSITVIDNQRDAFDAGRTWGQRLFFNQNGERASLTGQRKSEFLAGAQASSEGTAFLPDKAGREGLNMDLAGSIARISWPAAQGRDRVTSKKQSSVTARSRVRSPRSTAWRLNGTIVIQCASPSSSTRPPATE
jgi:hypothetical protein